MNVTIERKARIFPITEDGSVKKSSVVSGSSNLFFNLEATERKLLPGIVEVMKVSDNEIHDWIKPRVPKKNTKPNTKYCFLGFPYEPWHFSENEELWRANY